MSGINLNKKIGINLSKGSSIKLEKEGRALQKVCVGVNWGRINKKSFFGLINDSTQVDLDASVAFFGYDKKLVDIVYYKKLESSDYSVRHSGDDRVGDATADDYDNEVITVDLAMVNRNVKYVAFFLNSYLKQDFATIPYSKIRVFEGTPRDVLSVFATFNLSSEVAFRGKISMVMGAFVRDDNGQWQFKAIGEATEGSDIQSTVDIISEKYL